MLLSLHEKDEYGVVDVVVVVCCSSRGVKLAVFESLLTVCVWLLEVFVRFGRGVVWYLVDLLLLLLLFILDPNSEELKLGVVVKWLSPKVLKLEIAVPTKSVSLAKGFVASWMSSSYRSGMEKSLCKLYVQLWLLKSGGLKLRVLLPLLLLMLMLLYSLFWSLISASLPKSGGFCRMVFLLSFCRRPRPFRPTEKIAVFTHARPPRMIISCLYRAVIKVRREEEYE